MSKNVIIGFLVALVVFGGGLAVYAVMTNNDTPPVTTTPPVVTPPVTQTPAAPVAVTDNKNFFVSNATALVTGKVTPRGASTSYWYEYGKTEALGTRTSAQAVGSGWIQIPAPAYITGLSANTTYFFRLSAQNSLGTVTGATYSLMTNTTPPPVGSAPTIQTNDASDIIRTGATVNGRVNPKGFASSYWFEYGETNELGNTLALQGAGSGSTELPASAQISGLKPMTKYFFRINAQNQFGTVNGTIKNFTTTGPAAASAPSANAQNVSALTTSSATLNGKVNPNGAATSYWFEYSKSSLLSSILGSTNHTAVAGTGTSLVNVATPITGLESNTRYYYRVVAENSVGTVRSDIVDFRTK